MRTAPVAGRSTRRKPPPPTSVAHAAEEIWLSGSVERSPALLPAPRAGALGFVWGPEADGVAGAPVVAAAGDGLGAGRGPPPPPPAAPVGAGRPPAAPHGARPVCAPAANPRACPTSAAPTT